MIASPATAADKLSVNAFPNAKAIVFWAGIEHGMFAAENIDLDLTMTENSKTQREGIVSGRFMIAHSALDNAIDLIVNGRDILIVSGGDSGLNELMVQPDVHDWADIRGRWLTVDAPDTAYALQAKKILAAHGLKEGLDYELKSVGNGVLRTKAMLDDRRYAAGVLNLPFTIEAKAKGLKSFGRTTDLLGPYQAGGHFALRSWAQANGPLLTRYLRSFVKALRWVRDPANTAEAVALLAREQKIDSGMAAKALELLREPEFGYTVDAAFNRPGFDNALALRAEVQGGRDDQRAIIERAVDLSYWQQAVAGM